MRAFDTDVLTAILLGDPASVARATMIPPHEKTVPVVVIEELLRGRLQVIRQAEAGQATVSLPRAYDCSSKRCGMCSGCRSCPTRHRRRRSISVCDHGVSSV